MCLSTRKLFKIAVVIGISAFALITFIDYLLIQYEDSKEEESHNDVHEGDMNPGVLEHHRHKPPVYLPPEPATDLPIIVWWSNFIPEDRTVLKCPLGSCLVTKSRTELTNPKTNVSVFMWYGSDLDWHDLPLPRKPHHLWALLHEESPKNNWVFATDKGIELFNLTSTCSRHSSYPLVLQSLLRLEKLVQPVRVPTHLKSRGDVALVVYIQSDCNPPSDRDSYIRELMKYIEIDSYGKCVHNKDLPENLLNPLTFDSEDLLNIIGQYKFAISFENAICHDYITEKFWRPLYAGSVPIVRGSPTILDWAPSEKSIIVAEDFQTPKDLAEYLIHLDRNDGEYEKYLQWKRSDITNHVLLDSVRDRGWVVDEDSGFNFIDGFQCYVCDELYRRRETSTNEQQRLPLIADQSHYDCPIAEPALKYTGASVKERLGKMNEAARDEMKFWRYTAKCSEEKGAVISKVISQGGTQDQVTKALDNSCLDVLFGQV